MPVFTSLATTNSIRSCFPDTTSPVIYTLSLHDALPISFRMGFSDPETSPTISLSRSYRSQGARVRRNFPICELVENKERPILRLRSEEHTSELQSRFDLVCRLLLEKKKHSTVTQRCRSSRV